MVKKKKKCFAPFRMIRKVLFISGLLALAHYYKTPRLTSLATKELDEDMRFSYHRVQ